MDIGFSLTLPKENILSSHPWDNPPVCRECGSSNVAYVLYGLPNFDNKELRRKVKEGHVILGGCCIPSLKHLFWKCKDCGETTAVEINGGRDDSKE